MVICFSLIRENQHDIDARPINTINFAEKNPARHFLEIRRQLKHIFPVIKTRLIALCLTTNFVFLRWHVCFRHVILKFVFFRYQPGI